MIGVVTHDAIKNNPSRVYNYTVGVSDGITEVTTWGIINIDGNLPQLYYQYEMQVIDNVPRSSIVPTGLIRQISMVDILNKYFAYDILNVVKYESMTNNKFNLIWSVCPLPNKCTEAGLSASEKKILLANQPISAFIDIFKTNFQLDLIRTKIVKECNGVLNPPTVREDPFTIKLPYCGGFEYEIPADLFNDVQQENTRNLDLFFESPRGNFD